MAGLHDPLWKYHHDDNECANEDIGGILDVKAKGVAQDRVLQCLQESVSPVDYKEGRKKISQCLIYLLGRSSVSFNCECMLYVCYYYNVAL